MQAKHVIKISDFDTYSFRKELASTFSYIKEGRLRLDVVIFPLEKTIFFEVYIFKHGEKTSFPRKNTFQEAIEQYNSLL
jgi:hypothetical protein